MMNDTVWKYNPQSYYNQDNDKNPGRPEHYQDQRAFFLHRKHLAEAIERARRQDPMTAQQKADAEELERLAAEKRQQNKKAYNDMKMKQQQAKVQAVQQEEEEEDINGDVKIRDGKHRTINFEMTGINSFSVSFNFTTPDDVLAILRKYNAIYNKRRKEWTSSIMRYKECATEVAQFCRPRGIYVDLIPKTVFELNEYRIPFSD